ncbi:MAG: heme A synthase [Candidatus Heimdallarchaeota archaeon]
MDFRSILGNKSYYQKLSYVIPVVTLILMIWGNITKAIGGGLGCPDWPLCHGQIIPFDAPNTPISHLVGEYGHRIIAGTLSITVGLTFLFSYNFRDEVPRLFKLVVLISVLLIGEIIVGGLVILTQLENVLIGAIHLTLGVSIFGLAIIHTLWLQQELA